MIGKGFDFSVIRTLRKKHGLTIEELADKAKLTRLTIAKIEMGKGNPTMDTVEALARVFQLAASELIRLAEKEKAELAAIKDYQNGGIGGKRLCFPNLEMFHLRGEAGGQTEFDPGLHENTSEICFMLTGKLVLTVGGQAHELQAGMALHFKAMQEHQIDIIEDAEFLLIHPFLV
ncbi:MAG: helix-turn-helix domain-containing protein [Syntrophales bacterium]|nr:helix-turn-helix domain-containing protein [Syntrophales bacterium]